MTKRIVVFLALFTGAFILTLACGNVDTDVTGRSTKLATDDGCIPTTPPDGGADSGSAGSPSTDPTDPPSDAGIPDPPPDADTPPDAGPPVCVPDDTLTSTCVDDPEEGPRRIVKDSCGTPKQVFPCPDGCENGQCIIPPYCGDGVVQVALNEVCDDGNFDDTDECVRCERPLCGDGFIHKGFEACDDGNKNESDGCTSQCVAFRCGDGVITAGTGEECEDGNTINDDACSNTCKRARCGDGIIQPSRAENCDDGNLMSGDGCSKICRLEPLK